MDPYYLIHQHCSNYQQSYDSVSGLLEARSITPSPRVVPRVIPRVSTALRRGEPYIFSPTWKLLGRTGSLLEWLKTWGLCEVTQVQRLLPFLHGAHAHGRTEAWPQQEFLRSHWVGCTICVWMIMAAVFPLNTVFLHKNAKPQTNRTMIWTPTVTVSIFYTDLTLWFMIVIKYNCTMLGEQQWIRTRRS